MKKALKVRGIHRVGPCRASEAIIGCVVLGLVSSQCWAYSGGLGTLQAPYGLSSPEDLTQLSVSPKDYDKHFVLIADIDLAGYTFDQAVIAPKNASSVGILDSQRAFSGTINGDGHVVTNLRVTGSNHLGLVGVLEFPGQILGLGIVDANVVGTGRSLGMLVGNSDGRIRQCFAVGTVAGESEVGGLVGRNEGTIENCFTGGIVSGLDSVGGLMGRPRIHGDLSNAYSTCLIQRELGQDEGGLSGGNSEWAVFNSFWDIETSGISSGQGGTGLSTALMQDEQPYLEAGWDFVGESENGLADVWLMPESGGYPELSIFHGVRGPFPSDDSVVLGRCILPEDPNEVMWNGAEVFDVTWDHVSITEVIANPATHSALDPNHKTRTITVRGRVDVLNGENLLGIDTRQGVVCQVLGEQGEILPLKGRLSPFEPSFCWAMLPESSQSFELQFQLDPHHPMPLVLSQVDFYVHSLDYALLTTIDVPFESMDTWQTLVPGFDVMIENVVVEEGRWEYTLKKRVQGQPIESSLVPGAIECAIVDSHFGPRPRPNLWGADLLFDQRIIYGEEHEGSGGSVSSRSETIDGLRVTAKTTRSTGQLDISKIEYTFALSTRKRIVPLTLTDIPLP